MTENGTEPDTPAHRPGRNEPCHCGSGKKYKRCCLTKDEEADRDAREAELAEAPPPEPAEQEKPKEPAPPRHATEQPWKRGQQNLRGIRKFTGPRKVGGG